MSLGVSLHTQPPAAAIQHRGRFLGELNEPAVFASQAVAVSGAGDQPPQPTSQSGFDPFLDSPLRYLGFLNEIAAAGVHYFKTTLDRIPSPFKKILEKLVPNEKHWLRTGPLKQKIAVIEGEPFLAFFKMVAAKDKKGKKITEIKNGQEVVKQIEKIEYFKNELRAITKAGEKNYKPKLKPVGGLKGLALDKGHGVVQALLWVPAIGYALSHAIKKGISAYQTSRQTNENKGTALKKGLAAFGDYAAFHTIATVVVPALLITSTQDKVKDFFYWATGTTEKTGKWSASNSKLVRFGLVGIGLGMIPLIVKLLDPVAELLLDITYRPLVGRNKHFSKNHGPLAELKENFAAENVKPLSPGLTRRNALEAPTVAAPVRNTASPATPAASVYLEPLSPVKSLIGQQETNFLPLLTQAELSNYEVTPHHAHAIFERFI